LAFVVVVPCAGQTGSGSPGTGEQSENASGDAAHSDRAERDRLSLLDHSANTREVVQTVVPGRFLNDRTEKIMRQMVDAIVYAETPFSEVMLDLEATYGFSMLLDQSAVDDSLDNDTTVSVRLAGVSLERGLEELLKSCNAIFIVSDGIVRVISKDVAEDPEFFERRVFDCAALAGKLPKRIKDRLPLENSLGGVAGGSRDALPSNDEPSPSSPASSTVLATNSGQGFGGGGGNAVPRGPEMTTLEELISAVVCHDNWSPSGNGDAVLYELNGRLIVHAPGPVMREVRDFLEQLKAEYGVAE
jgi:hypothetical protein